MILSWLFVSLGAFLLGAPLLILFGTGLNNNPLIFLPVLAVSIALAILVRICKKGRAALCVLFSALVFILSLVRARMLGMTYTAFLPSLLCAAMLPFHLLYLCRAPGEEYPPTLWYLGLLVHALALFLLRTEYFAPAKAALHVVSPLYYVFFIFALNEYGLTRGMAGDRRPSRLMRLRNRIRAGLLAALLMICTHIEAIKKAMQAVLNAVRDFIAWLLSWLAGDGGEIVTAPAERGSLDLSGLAEGGEPSAFWRFLEAVMRIVALVIAAVLLILIIKKFIQVCIRALRWLADKLRTYAVQVSDAYEDTVESLLDWGEVRRGLFGRRAAPRKKEPPVDWESLSPRENVRMRYRQLRIRREAPDHLTARHVILAEKSTVQAADIYDRARYSSQDISPADAESMKKLLS